MVIIIGNSRENSSPVTEKSSSGNNNGTDYNHISSRLYETQSARVIRNKDPVSAIIQSTARVGNQPMYMNNNKNFINNNLYTASLNDSFESEDDEYGNGNGNGNMNITKESSRRVKDTTFQLSKGRSKHTNGNHNDDTNTNNMGTPPMVPLIRKHPNKPNMVAIPMQTFSPFM